MRRSGWMAVLCCAAGIPACAALAAGWALAQGEGLAPAAKEPAGAARPAEPAKDDPLKQGLVLYLDFEDDFSGGVFKDRSGQGNDGRASVERKQLPTASPGIVGQRAAEITGCYPDMPENTGQYIAVARSDSLCNLAQGTIALWARYNGDQEPHWNCAVLFYAFHKTGEDNQKKPVGKAGTWALGRNYTDCNMFQVFDQAGSRAGGYKGILTFPDAEAWQKAIHGKSEWNHYAVTWDGKEFKGYFNGTQFGSFSQADVPYLSVSPYLCVGANAHNSMPEENPNYRYPNHGFTNGSLDDVRIYNRALSAEGIKKLVALGTGQRVCDVTPKPPPKEKARGEPKAPAEKKSETPAKDGASAPDPSSKR